MSGHPYALRLPTGYPTVKGAKDEIKNPFEEGEKIFS